MEKNSTAVQSLSCICTNCHDAEKKTDGIKASALDTLLSPLFCVVLVCISIRLISRHANAVTNYSGALLQAGAVT